MNLFAAFLSLLRRDLLLGLRSRGELLNAWLFFVIVVCLFPLGSRPESALLREFAPAILWSAALLATLLSLERMLRSDLQDGSLDLLLLSPQPISVLVLAKTLAHWLTTGALLIPVAPVLALGLGLPLHCLPALVASLLLGTPVLSLVGAIGVALTAGLRGGGVLLALLILPLYTPVLIFGAQTVAAAAQGLPVSGPLYMLAALLLLSITLAPLAAGAALRITAEQ
ncbi:MAG: heme exporter protein CcmB [Nevskiales bacterium]